MSAPGINRTIRPGSSAVNQAAGPVSPGESVPSVPSSMGGQWSPTVAHLLVLIVLEVVAFAGIRYAFRIVQK